jgi:hypothetical protein
MFVIDGQQRTNRHNEQHPESHNSGLTVISLPPSGELRSKSRQVQERFAGCWPPVADQPIFAPAWAWRRPQNASSTRPLCPDKLMIEQS